MNLLLALACVLQADAGPEETFRKIEESIEKARTLSFSFKIEGMGAKEAPDRELKARGVMALKEGGKYHCTLKMLRDGHEQETTLVFDGTRMSMKRDDGEPRVNDVPKVHRGAAPTMVARLGALMSGMMPRGEGGPEEDVKKALELKNLKAGEDDKDAKTLTYSVRLATPAGARAPGLDCKLWYDPKTLVLLKRTITVRQGETVEGSLTETYSDYVLNGEIPDDRFKIAPPKPKDEKK